MISINAFSAVDLLAVFISTYVLLVFFYRTLRVTNRTVDLLFTGVVSVVWLQSILLLLSDNIIPVGLAADAVPDAAERTLALYRLMYVAGNLLLTLLTHFTLRYTQSSHLHGARVFWLYAAAVAIAPLYYTEGFLRARLAPLESGSGWLCAVPWQPEAGPWLSVFLALWLLANVYVQFLFHRQARTALPSTGFAQHNFVRSGVTMWGIAGLVSVVLGATGYAGVDPSILLVAAAMVVLSIGLAEDHLRAEKRTHHIREIFGRYVADDVVAQLLQSPRALELGGDRRVVSVMFADLRGFTALAERLRPEQVVELLNTYLGRMAAVIVEHHGTINEFLGDGIMVMFGAPIQRADSAENAVRCALAMQQAMPEVNTQLRPLGIPALEMGIGVNTGEVVVGNIGSEKRAKYGVVGSNVNLAARIESATVGGQILVSQSTYEVLRDRIHVRQPVALQAKGAREAILVHDVVGLAGDALLSLRCSEETWTPFAVGPTLEGMIVDANKQLPGASFSVQLVALSGTGAQVFTGEDVPVGTNLRLRVAPRRPGEPAIDFYGKVISRGTDSGRYHVRFTAIPAEAQSLEAGVSRLLQFFQQPVGN